MKCKHITYKKGCKVCEDVKGFCNSGCRDYGLFEGYEMDNKKDWAEMVEYYNKWVDYDPTDEMYDDQFVERKERGGK